MAMQLEQSVISDTLAVEIAQIAERVRRAVVVIDRPHGNGAGIIWRSDGGIVTNRHVVGCASQVHVRLADGRRADGRVVARHPEYDLAVVHIPLMGVPVAEVGDSATVRPGQLAIAVGHPFGYRDAVSVGVIVASGQIATKRGPRPADLLQSDVKLAPGNSGGPLLDASGRVIGINTMVAGRLSLAVPSQVAERFVRSSWPGGTVAYIGVRGMIVVLDQPRIPAGLLLTEVIPGSPGDRAGLMVGDILVTLGDVTVVDQESVPAALLRLAPGRPVAVRVVRGGTLREFIVVPAERVWSG